MSVSEFEMFQDQQRSDWVRLRTLVRLRWFAAAGQAATIFVAVQIMKLQIEVGYAAIAVGASVIANLFCMFLYPENKRLSEREATLWLVFDVLQLCLLLFVTGGLDNPFAMFVLVPVTVAATIIHLRSTILLGLTAIILISLMSEFSLPIATDQGVPLVLPSLFHFGFLFALLIAVVFLAIYVRQVTIEMHAMGEALLATQLALAREQKLTDLGGVVAATAHELGTPLATIKLASSELIDELDGQPGLQQDAALIREQAARCRDILHSMGRAGKDDLLMRHAPLEAVVKEAAEPHMLRGKTVNFHLTPTADVVLTQPTIARQPEIIHGLRNLIQNAVDFSRTTVNIDLSWSATDIHIRISDDGHGFPQSVIGRIGDPYVRPRRLHDNETKRPGYEGMGLGLFIAKTLLERSGATLSFANSRRHGHASWSGQATGGAIVDVSWSKGTFTNINLARFEPLGENIPHAS